MTARPDLAVVLRHFGVDFSESRREQLTLCVSHSESKPSMSVNLDRDLVHCHSCGFAGDAFTVIMAREHIGFRQAVEYAEKHFEYVREAAPEMGRQGLSGAVRSGRGGYRPKIARKGIGA